MGTNGIQMEVYDCFYDLASLTQQGDHKVCRQVFTTRLSPKTVRRLTDCFSLKHERSLGMPFLESCSRYGASKLRLLRSDQWFASGDFVIVYPTREQTAGGHCNSAFYCHHSPVTTGSNLSGKAAHTQGPRKPARRNGYLPGCCASAPLQTVRSSGHSAQAATGRGELHTHGRAALRTLLRL
nr:PREDICTED: uncharacterized protein LOC103553236 [Equus przewalskii]